MLLLSGVLYASWGVMRFDPRADPRLAPGPDGPVARLAFLYDGYRPALRIVAAQSEGEQRLVRTLERGMNFSAGLLTTLLRLFLGTFIAFSGLVMLSVCAERARLLKVIVRLQQE